ncbi:MAG: hypothetical protein CXX80_05955 [Methanobacteriota archaeon]|nr:MAG: hypothetical protein CXX80_05955 [Euryarchaeota archaeon]
MTHKGTDAQGFEALFNLIDNLKILNIFEFNYFLNFCNCLFNPRIFAFIIFKIYRIFFLCAHILLRK